MKMLLVICAIVIGIFSSMPFLFSKGKNQIKGDGNLVTKTIELSEFSEMKLGDRIEGNKRIFGKQQTKATFNYTQKDAAPTLQITTDENLFPHLEIKVEEGCLYIRGKENRVYLAPTQMTIEGSTRNLTGVSIVGCMNFTSDTPLNVENLDVRVSGVGSAKINDLACGRLDCSLAGVGDIYLKGKVDSGYVAVSGVGSVHAFDCVMRVLDCEVSGVGSAEVNATEVLNRSMSGVGSISYKGEGKGSVHSSGVGSIHQVE